MVACFRSSAHSLPQVSHMTESATPDSMTNLELEARIRPNGRLAVLKTVNNEFKYRFLLCLAICLYVITVTHSVFGIYDRFGMQAFDLGIFDQATWLISKGHIPLVSVRGVHILGDH